MVVGIGEILAFNRKCTIVVGLLFAVIFLALMFMPSCQANNDGPVHNINNGTNYTTIQAAIGEWVEKDNTPTFGGYGEALIGTDNYIYVARCLYASSIPYFWRYDPLTNNWNSMNTSELPTGAFRSGTAFAWDHNNYIYTLLGGRYSDSNRNLFYRYSVADDKWEKLIDTPHAQGAGDAITWSGYDNNIYMIMGSKGHGTVFACYNLSENSWNILPFNSNWTTTDDGASLVWTGEEYLYALQGEVQETVPNQNFSRFSIRTKKWEDMSHITEIEGVGDGASLLWVDEYPNYIFALGGGSCLEDPGYNFYCYSISDDSWEQLESIPYPIGEYVGNRLGFANGHIYYWQGAPSTWLGGGNKFCIYKLSQIIITVCQSGCDYTSIQAAVDAALPGDTIQVLSGTYHENVNVTKQLTLRGVDTGSGQPIVDANGNGNVITLSADSITLDGFIATNSGKTSGDAGIKVISNNNLITGNIVINNNYGVHLEYSSYNSITGNNISINEEGVYLYSSGINNLTGNTANKNDYEGFFFWDSTDNNITGNNVSENEFGILMWDSSNNSLTDNKVNNNSRGIYLTNSIENTLRNNQMSGNSYNFGVLGWDVVILGTSHYSNKIQQDFQMSSNSNNFGGLDLLLQNDIDTSNLVDNKPIYYLIGASDIVIDSSSNAGIVYCINCDNVTVQDLNLVNNYVGVFFYHTGNSSIQDNYLCNNDWYGIVLYSAYNNTVLRNNASDNGWEGIYLFNFDHGRIINNIVNNSYWNSMNIQFSSNNKLSGNNINNGLRGLNLFKSDNNTITGNIVLDNYYEGIMLDTSMNNTIYHNVFADNSPNAVDFSLNNLWDFGYPTGGNYWGDYTGIDADGDGIGDTPYNISDSAGIQDKYPLMEPWGGVDLNPPYVTITSPANLETDVNIDTNIIATFNKSMNNSTLNNKTFKVCSLGSDKIIGETFKDTNGSWNSSNFQAFNYSEELTVWQTPIDDTHRTIGEHNLTYTTHSLLRDYQVYINEGIGVGWSGNYSVIGWLGEEHVVVDNLTSKWIISRLIFEQNSTDAKTLHIGDTWDFGDGYSLKLVERGHSGDALLLAFYNSSGKLYEDIIANQSTYIFTADLGAPDDSPIFVTYLNEINLTHIELKYTWLASQDTTVIRNGESFGVFETKSVTTNAIRLVNEENVLLTRDSIVPLADNLMFEVEDTKTVQYSLIYQYQTETSVDGDISYDNASRTVTFDPVSNLMYDTNYISYITTGAEDLAGNGLIEDYEWEFKTMHYTPSPTPSRNGGGGGGGGGTSGENYYNIVITETDRQSVFKNSNISFIFDLEGNIVKHINFTALNSAGTVAAKVEILNNTSTLVSTPPPDEVYKNLNIWVGNYGWATEKNMADTTVTFMVSKSWVIDNDIGETSIALYRYSDDTWHKLVTRKIAEDANSLQFEAETTGFSPFAVTGKKTMGEPGGEGIIAEPIVTAEKTPIPTPTEKKGIPGFSLFAGLSILLIAVQLLRKKN